MKCSRCSAEIPAQSRFCLRCGTAIPTTTTTQMPAGYNPNPAFTPQRATDNKKLYATIGLLAVVVLALGAFVAKGLFQKPAQNDKGQLVQAPGMGTSGTLVQAPGDSKPAPIVQAPADSTPAPIVQQPGEAPPPADVMDYLQFLRGIEKEKIRILTEFSTTAKSMLSTSNINIIGAMAGAEGDNGIDAAMETYNKQKDDAKKQAQVVSDRFNALTTQLYTRQPPSSCIPLRNAYAEHLAMASTLSSDVMDLFGGTGSTPLTGEERTQATGDVLAKAQKIISSNEKQKTMIEAADRELTEVYRKYHLRQDWNVTDPQEGGGGLFSKMAGMFNM